MSEVKIPKSMIRALEKRRDAVAKQRDILSNLVDEYSALHDSCKEAVEDLEMALDRLSQYA